MHERIKKLRRYFNLTQQEFADKLHIKRGSVATFERGNSDPSDAAIALICKTFNVNETWLRTGEGGMLDPAADDALGAFIRERNLTPTDRILIEKFVSLSTKARWEVVKYVLDIADALYEECSASRQAQEATQEPAPSTTKLYIAARDGSRIETEVEGGLTIPEEDSEIP